jgi:hypothetical protein
MACRTVQEVVVSQGQSCHGASHARSLARLFFHLPIFFSFFGRLKLFRVVNL